MRPCLFAAIITIAFSSCQSQNSTTQKTLDKNSVELYYQYSPTGGYDLVYEADSDVPYTGELISESASDKVVINFKDGLKDGPFLRFNTEGDTIQYRQYDQGNELFAIEYEYEDGEIVERLRTEKTNGNKQDEQIFIAALNLIRQKEYDELDQFLNPLWPSYGSTFKTCEQLFGELQTFHIKGIDKEYIEHQDSEHLRARIDLTFRDTAFDVGFLVVEYKDKLSGQGFSFPAFHRDLKPDDLITKVIKDVNEGNVDEILRYTQLTEQHRELLENDLEKLDEIEEAPVFLNSHLGLFPTTQLSKDFLIKAGDDDYVLKLTYQFQDDGEVELMSFRLLPYRKPFQVMHKLF